MKKKYVTLNNTWKELLFSASGFGPNLLMVLMGAYFTDAVNPAALKVGDLQAIGTACYIMPLVFPILWALAKIFDGLIDIPLAALTDGLKTKWGRRRPPILVCFIPMCLSYIMCWNPIFGEAESARLANTIWIVCWALVFFATYTMSLIAYYGSLSTVCSTDNQRLRVSSFKSFFDTISYCLVYALVPLVLEGLNMHIDKFAMLLVPLMITMLIPVFMIKEGERFEKKALEEGYDITPLAEEEKVGIVESIKLTFTNKPFIKWCIVNCCSFFGLQMFLVAMNAMILGGMGMNGTQMAILNTCAFAPVPLMLYMFNKLKQRKGIRFAYQTCLLSFAFCILTFDIASVYVMGNDNLTLQIIIGCLGGVIGSWAIGSFFMMPYMIPAQISSVEEKLTGKNHSAMYFAAQAFTSSIVSAIASSLVYENIKMLFISKSAKGIVRALNVTEAALKFNVQEADVFNLGVLLVPIIVCVFCIIGFVFTFKMPKNFSAEEVSKEIGLEKEYEENKHLFKQEKLTIYPKESILVNVGLWILSGSIFGLIWRYLILSSVNKFSEIKNKNLHFILSILVLPYYGVLSYKVNKRIVKEFKSKGVNCVDLSVLYLIIGLFGLGVVSSIIMQYHLNKLLKYIDE
jgi:Na+/melibiose symporter-like transporter